MIDGGDGSGKATQTKLLVQRLKLAGVKVATFDFPQYTQNFFGKLLKDCLIGKHGDFMVLPPEIVSVLYAADRWETKAKIEKALASGKCVVLDRYVSANQIHQGSKIADTKKRKEFLTWLDTLEHGVFGLPRPSLVVYLEVSPQVSETLMAGRAPVDLAESDRQHQERTRRAAVRMTEELGHWVRVKCDTRGAIRTREAIAAAVWDQVSRVVGVC